MRYAQIDDFETVNGKQIGMSLYVQGCHFRCPGCFNTDAWNFDGGREWTNEVKNKFIQLAGRTYIKRISILGGCPLTKENINSVAKLITELKEKYPEKQIWIYTGYSWEDIWFPSNESLTNHSIEKYKRFNTIKNADVLVEGRFIEELKDITLPWRGSSNQRVIDIKKTLEKGEIVKIN